MRWRTKLALAGKSESEVVARTRVVRSAPAGLNGRLQLASMIGNRALGRLLQAKLAIGSPDDKYEREADRVADQVMRMPEAEEQTTSEAAAASVSGARPVDPLLGVGRRLSGPERAFFEPRLGADLSGVRVHTGARAAELAHGLGARALTVGGDVAFADGQYALHSAAGRRLMAHELVHVVQQRAADPAVPASEHALTAAPVSIQRWTSLGSVGWDNPFSGGHVTHTLSVGTQSEWERHLRNVDDEDEFYHRLFPFLRTVVGEEWDRVTRYPYNFRNYHNNISRDPTDSEIRSLVLALFAVGESLDLPHGSLWEGGPFVRTFDALMSDFLRQYQDIVIAEYGRRGMVLPSTAVRSVAEQSGRQVRSAMIQSAGATATKSVDILVAANDMAAGTPREVARARAFETMRNAGRLIRYTLEEHAAAVAYEEALLSTIFDLVWARLPGGGALVSTAKDLLKLGFKQMIKAAASDSEPKKQAENINAEFVAALHRLVRGGHMTTADLNDAINGFEAVRRP